MDPLARPSMDTETYTNNNHKTIETYSKRIGKGTNQTSLDRLYKQVPEQDAPNLVYTLVPLEHLGAIEKEIKQCLLELVKVED